MQLLKECGLTSGVKQNITMKKMTHFFNAFQMGFRPDQKTEIMQSRYLKMEACKGLQLGAFPEKQWGPQNEKREYLCIPVACVRTRLVSGDLVLGTTTTTNILPLHAIRHYHYHYLPTAV